MNHLSIGLTILGVVILCFILLLFYIFGAIFAIKRGQNTQEESKLSLDEVETAILKLTKQDQELLFTHIYWWAQCWLVTDKREWSHYVKGKLQTEYIIVLTNIISLSSERRYVSKEEFDSKFVVNADSGLILSWVNQEDLNAFLQKNCGTPEYNRLSAKFRAALYNNMENK